jgi:hypothetical protein
MVRAKRAAPAMLLALLALVLASAAAAAEPVRITKEELKRRMGTPGMSIVDVRVGEGGLQSGRKIMGAVREDPFAVNDWAGRYPKNRPIVLYCS